MDGRAFRKRPYVVKLPELISGSSTATPVDEPSSQTRLTSTRPNAAGQSIFGTIEQRIVRRPGARK
jgi:hypothetical protein